MYAKMGMRLMDSVLIAMFQCCRADIVSKPCKHLTQASPFQPLHMGTARPFPLSFPLSRTAHLLRVSRLFEGGRRRRRLRGEYAPGQPAKRLKRGAETGFGGI